MRVTLRLLLLLPKNINEIFSLEYEQQEKLFRFLTRIVNFGDTWKEREVVNTYDKERQPASLLSALGKLREQCVQTLELPDSSVGSRILLYNFTSNLHVLLSGAGQPNKSITQVMFHQSLVLSSAAKDRYFWVDASPLFNPDLVGGERYDGMKSALIDYCRFICSKRLLGLPRSFHPELFFHFQIIMEEGFEEEGIQCLETLFRHFILQDPHKSDPAYPTTWEVQLETLNKILETLMKHTKASGPRKSIGLAKRMRRLMNGIRFHGEPELRDVQWILDGYDTDPRVEPFYIRDVQWILNGSDPRPRRYNLYGDERLDFQPIRQQLLEIFAMRFKRRSKRAPES